MMRLDTVLDAEKGDCEVGLVCRRGEVGKICRRRAARGAAARPRAAVKAKVSHT